jgi:tungstate transport system permease protein
MRENSFNKTRSNALDIMRDGFIEAFRLLFTLDREVMGITFRTLQVSGVATLISVFIGIPIGAVLALTSFFGRGFLVSLVNFGMGLPPVVVGLATWLTLTRYGPLGMLGLLYTPTAMILARRSLRPPSLSDSPLPPSNP